MATCLNGWAGIQSETDSRLVRITVPGTGRKITVRREAAPLFAAILADIHKQLIPLSTGPLDSWEYREARSGAGLSNHSGAVAVDFRYDVLLADNELHWPMSKHAIMHKLLDKYTTSRGKRIFGWGGDWSPGRSADEMHLELIQSWSPGSQGSSCLPTDCADAIKRLGLRPDGTVGLVRRIVPARPAKPAQATQSPPLTSPPTVHVSSVQPGSHNSQVGLVQKTLKSLGFDPGPVDGAFGEQTQAAYASFQRSLGYSGADADGTPGVKSLALLGNRGRFLVAP